MLLAYEAFSCSLLWINTSWMPITAAVCDSTKDGAKNAQNDRVPAEKLIAPRETPAGACTSLAEQSSSSVSTFLLMDSEGEGGVVSDSLSHLLEGRRASEMLSALLGARLHTHIAEFVFPILLGSICFLFSLVCCLLDSSAQGPVWNTHMHRQGMGGRKSQL